MLFELIPFRSEANQIQKNLESLKSLVEKSDGDVILCPAHSLSACYSSFERDSARPPAGKRDTSSYLTRVSIAMEELANSLKLHQVLFLVEWSRENELMYYGLTHQKIAYRRRLELQKNPNFLPQKMIYRHQGVDLGLMVEDELMYYTSPVGSEFILLSEAQPFHSEGLSDRLNNLKQASREAEVPLLQVNLVGLQENRLFEGISLVIENEEITQMSDPFKRESLSYDSQKEYPPLTYSPPYLFNGVLNSPIDCARVKTALVQGIKEYCQQVGFQRVVLGISGGIDSALVAALAAQAIGGENLTLIALPSMFSSEGSLTDSEELAKNLGARYEVISIKPIYDAFIASLEPLFQGTQSDLTEENLQARIRGTLLMAESNKRNELLLTTGNKSECAIGYATLYGDMCGGLGVIGDLYKTEVYLLSQFINEESLRESKREIIPQNTLTKPPSAELRPDQKDQDTLPPYEILDDILRLYLDQQRGVESILEAGFQKETIEWVIKQLHTTEYKRRQAAPSLSVAKSSFFTNRSLSLV